MRHPSLRSLVKLVPLTRPARAGLLVLFVPACLVGAPKAPTADDRALAAAVARMCDVDRQAGLSADADPLAIGPKRTAWIAANVDHPDVIELRTLMSVKGAADQASMLRDRAQALGLASCPLADTLARTNEGGLSP
jgi:hypothetical protein